MSDSHFTAIMIGIGVILWVLHGIGKALQELLYRIPPVRLAQLDDLDED